MTRASATARGARVVRVAVLACLGIGALSACSGTSTPAADQDTVAAARAPARTTSPDTSTPTTASVPSRYPTDVASSPWVVVNKQHPLRPLDYAPDDLVTVQGYQVRAAVAPPLRALLAAAARDGVTLPLVSAYRSYDYQRQVHRASVQRNGQEQADRTSARAGYSEHQTGLAVDLGSTTDPGCAFEPCYSGTVEGRWLDAHAADFGFLHRYTDANSAVTGYSPEGWHFRYVGTDLLAEMRRRGVTTLEELFGVSGGPGYAAEGGAGS